VQTNHLRDRRTSVEQIFEYLYEEIHSLRLRPGDRLSEADIAAKFGVSRQPVRDAFARLEGLDLLRIRPQRATVVRRFSAREIEKSRFVRAAIETEVLRRAASRCDGSGAALLNACVDRQRAALDSKDYRVFKALDYEFHETLCKIAEVEFAFEVIVAEKAKIDRLCMLGLSKEDRMHQILSDHVAIAEAVKAHNEVLAIKAGMLHLSRLDETIAVIAETNEQYFEPDPDR
jgi:GntR family transcriptional regulator, rspAB operon transcriptional repressor